MKRDIPIRPHARDEDGNVIIDMTVKNDDDFLSPYSREESPVISEDVADFIENETLAMPPRERYTLRIHSDCIDDAEKVEYRAAIAEYYAEKYVADKKELRVNRSISLVLLAVGIILLSLAFQVEHHVWSEVIDIAAWVMLWESVDIWVFKNRELGRSRKRCLNLMEMKIEYVPLNLENKK